ncbi:MAG: PKD domain-containing protein [Bacteroidetes bacterium]|nr:PKD domain-containing protein [Bacteroidota bacterium]
MKLTCTRIQCFLLCSFLIAMSMREYTYSQDVFFFVSGKGAFVQQTGDELHQYDFIIRAPSGADTAVLEIFDASIGSGADVIGFSKTVTLFQLFQGNTANERTLCKTLETIDEYKYLNRWFTVDTLVATEKMTTWIVRAQGLDGDGVNAFKLRVTPISSFIGKAKWRVTALHLPVTLVGLNENEEAQFKPMTTDMKRISDIIVRGEEQAVVLLRDSYGSSVRFPIPKSVSFETIVGQTNEWGLAISGSQIRVNNVVVRTLSGDPLEWDAEAIVVRKPTPPLIGIDQYPMTECTQVRLQLSNTTRRLFWNVTPQWVIGKSVFLGDSVIAEFPGPGTYLATLLLPTQGVYFPRFWKQSFSIVINAPPIAKLVVPKALLSPNEAVVLSAVGSYDPEKRQLTYQWFINGEYRGNQPTLRFFSGQPGVYDVKLIVSDGSSNSPCSQDDASAVLRVNTQPYGEIRGPHVIARSRDAFFTLNNVYDADGDEIQVQWFGTGISGDRTAQTVRVRIDTARVYTLKAVLNDQTSTSNATYTISFPFRVNAEPRPVFQLPEKAAPGEKLLLSAQLSADPDNSQLRYRWIISDGSEFFTPTTYVVFQDPGTYTVTLTVDDGEGVENSVQSLSKTIHINAPPKAVITAVGRSNTSLITFSAEESIDNDGDLLQYQWNFGDGTSTTGKRVSHLYEKSGTYTVTLVVNDGQNLSNSIQSTQHVLTINNNPVARLSAPKICAPEVPFTVDGTASYDSDGVVVEYMWYVNGVEVARGQRATISVPSPGDYALALFVRDNSEFDNAVGMTTTTVHCNAPPLVKWSVNPSIAEPYESITFDASMSRDPEGNPITVRWEFSDGTVLRGTKVQKKFSLPGKQVIRLVVDDGQQVQNSVQEQVFSVLVNNPPIVVTEKVIQSNEQRIFLDATRSYDIDGHALLFDWLLPDGTHRTEAAFWWQVPTAGTHILTLSVSDGQGKKNSIVREVVRIQINRPPVAVVDSCLQTCSGYIVLFNSTRCYDPDNDIFSTHWDFGDGVTSDETNPTHIFTKPGLYSVQLTLNDGKSSQPTVARIPVIVEGSPQAVQRFADTTICANIPLEFDGTLSIDPNGPLGSFTWDFGDGTSALGPTVTHVYTKAGTYTVTLTVVGSGSGRCSRVSQAISTVRVVEGPQAVFMVPQYVSVGENVQLDARASQTHGKDTRFFWHISGKDSHYVREGIVSSISFPTPGEYTIRLTVTIDARSSCTTATAIRTLHVNESPKLVWSLPTAVALGEPLLFDASQCYDPDGILTSYTWLVDGNEVASAVRVPYVFTTPGYHTVRLRVADNSKTTTQYAEETKQVFVNTQPVCNFIVPEAAYVGETLELVPVSTTDADGDTLLFRWKIDGTELTEARIQCREPGIHTITLVADDKRLLKNSIDSVTRLLNVHPAPDLNTLFLPLKVTQGSTLSLDSVTTENTVYFVDGMKHTRQLTFSSVETNSVTLAWIPKDAILQEKTVSIRVLEPLRFVEVPSIQRVEWNPANPRMVVVAPPINRGGDARVQYEWRKGGTIVGVGPKIEVPLQKGRNSFRVRAIESDVWQSKPCEIEVVFLCE